MTACWPVPRQSSLEHFATSVPSCHRPRCKFGSLQVVAAGSHHRINLDPFLAEGCSVDGDGNVEVLKSPIGSESFCASYSQTIAEKQRTALNAVAALPDTQVLYYLLRHSCNASRMTYLSRTTPLRHSMMACATPSRSLSALASPPMLGPRLCCHFAMAVLGSSRLLLLLTQRTLGHKLQPVHAAWRCGLTMLRPGVDPHADVVSAVGHCNQCLSDACIPATLQLRLGEELRHNEVAKRKADAGPADVYRLHAASAPRPAA